MSPCGSAARPRGAPPRVPGSIHAILREDPPRVAPRLGSSSPGCPAPRPRPCSRDPRGDPPVSPRGSAARPRGAPPSVPGPVHAILQGDPPRVAPRLSSSSPGRPAPRPRPCSRDPRGDPPRPARSPRVPAGHSATCQPRNYLSTH